MNNFLIRILNSNGYNVNEDAAFELFGNEHEFFLIANFEIEEIEDFFKTEKLERLISEFQKLYLDNDKIKKNTSLFVTVKAESLETEYEHLKNIIMKIEEDEYYFRKYIIFYTEEGLRKLEPSVQNLFDYIQGDGDASDGESLFDKFEKNMFFDDSYFIAMQLIIKLPFISLPHSDNHFETIEDKIKSQIETAELVEQEQQVGQILGLFHDDNIGSQLEDTTIIGSLRQILED